jgi:hypothetical protein
MNAETTVKVACPYCGETVELLIDCSAGSQQYVEDCQVCCGPMNVNVGFDTEGTPIVGAQREDD